MSRGFLGFVALLALGCSEDVGPDGGGGEGASAAEGTGSGSGSKASGTGSMTTASTGQGGAAGSCPATPSCDAPLPDFGPARSWNHTSSSFTASTGFDNHRGRDMFYNPGEDLWVMAKFAYGVADDDIKDEDVDVYVLPDCGATWQLLGTVQTTDDGEHPTVEGVEDTGGWVYFKVPPELGLGEGRHRFELVVAGDLTHTEVYLEIVKPGTPLVVSDIDGTLTTSENEEFSALLTGSLPDANPSAPEVLWALADQGYRVFYMTARPHFLGGRTREFLAAHGFPPGLVHTTLTFTGATGGEAVAYKSGELAAIGARGLVPAWGLGNTASDAQAYSIAGIEPAEHRIVYQFDDTMYGCRRVDDYATLLPEITGAPPAICP